MELVEKQLEAVQVATNSLRCIISGGAGSGKTTVIRAIIEELNNQSDGIIVLCAPTGKAAARITEATGYKAHTVHSACGIFPVDDVIEGIGRTETISLAEHASTIIIDEASMLTDSLLAAVCETVSVRCRVILVGDPNQLPPVGAGYPFRDLINSKRIPHVHLDVCHRQAGKLLHNCYSILQGNPDDLVYDAGKGNRKDVDWAFLECNDDSIQNAIKRLFSKDNCEETLGIPAEELLVLTPLNKGDCGRIQLNRVVQKVYHESRGRVAPAYKEVEGGIDRYVPGDRVIYTKNDKGLGLVNGDTGTVLNVGADTVVVDWDGIGIKPVETGINIQLAWVLTCHKAQGSQYRKVLVIQAGKHFNNFLKGIVNRSWVYTAATRSKEATIFLGTASTFRKCVNTPSVDTRETLLSRLLNEES